jgi:hypothetical protein
MEKLKTCNILQVILLLGLSREISYIQCIKIKVMTFKELKEKVALSYMEYLDHLTQEEKDGILSEILEADIIFDLIDVLDGLGFGEREAYLFVIESILE